MVGTVTIDRRTGNGKYSDVLDVCDELADGDYGSTVNALVTMARKTKLYRDAMARISERKAALVPQS